MLCGATLSDEDETNSLSSTTTYLECFVKRKAIPLPVCRYTACMSLLVKRSNFKSCLVAPTSFV